MKDEKIHLEPSKDISQETTLNWESETEEKVWLNLVGEDFGNNPQEKIAEIKNEKAQEAITYIKFLKLKSGHRVLEIGSGFGFMAEHISEVVKELYCVDISRVFHNVCKRRLEKFSNITCLHIKYGDFSQFEDESFDAIYSHAVFIHFNLFDVYIYLKEIHRMLPLGGKFIFDYADSDKAKLVEESYFMDSMQRYKKDRNAIAMLLQWNSYSGIFNICQQLGFKVLHALASEEQETRTLVIEKRSGQ